MRSNVAPARRQGEGKAECDFTPGNDRRLSRDSTRLAERETLIKR